MPSALPLLLGYAQVTLDRHSERRDDSDWIDSLANNREARTLLFAGEIPILKRLADGTSSSWFTRDEAAKLGEPTDSAFLGTDEYGPLFAAALDAKLVEPLKEQGYGAADMRTVAMRSFVTPEETSNLGMAKALFAWHATHRFCAKCGQPSKPAHAGWRRDCPHCGAQHFPRTDPVVIMLSVIGDKCLLGRSPRFAAPMYSCLAGFMEPGESIEQAVRRETREEAGVICGRVDYLLSQPWPFPMSLMIGCIAQAENEELTIDHNELADARWFSRDEALSILENRHPDGIQCPPVIAIAHHLLRHWVEKG
ncbi:NAD(+) diphosphatase [Terrarubrum flagellatum]|uniref:NAD(+) diphosphatase n=1 Tax=Terrirubrum flagellatum TaxID=2895980 RepID=UPI003144DCA6